MIGKRVVGVAGACFAVALAACQGSSGTGALSIPLPGSNNPAGPGTSAQSVSRQQTLEGAVTLGSDRSEIPLPSLDGFSVSLQLGTPAPAASPAPSPAASGRAGKAALAKRASAAPATPSPSVTGGGTSPVPVPSGSSAAASPQASSSPTAAGKMDTKTTVYPESAPDAPSPKPSGDVQTFAKRTALVRGYIAPTTDLNLYGLGAIRFTLPAAELTSGRGFTVAVFTAGKKHHEQLVAFDASPVLLDSVVASSLTNDPLVLKKSSAYLIMLYGDELPPAAAGAYPTPGSNPFPTQTPGGQPGQNGLQQPGYPQQPGAPQYSTPTPIP